MSEFKAGDKAELFREPVTHVASAGGRSWVKRVDGVDVVCNTADLTPPPAKLPERLVVWVDNCTAGDPHIHKCGSAFDLAWFPTKYPTDDPTKKETTLCRLVPVGDDKPDPIDAEIASLRERVGKLRGWIEVWSRRSYRMGEAADALIADAALAAKSPASDPPIETLIEAWYGFIRRKATGSVWLTYPNGSGDGFSTIAAAHEAAAQHYREGKEAKS